MKLTLRTLLAYLNETVSEDEAASLRKKIKESPAIRELIQRIRQVVSQPQLLAPRVIGKGLGADPNYAAEYIDSTLDLEQVAEFEKLAIGSDICLAEIAESHQILASLAEIDEGVSGRLRNRLYKSTESIYKSESDEPAMFPVVEDHASIQEEYDDVESSSKQKSKFVLAPPKQEPNIVGESSQTDRPAIAAPPVVGSKKNSSLQQDERPFDSESSDHKAKSFKDHDDSAGEPEFEVGLSKPVSASPAKSADADPRSQTQPRLLPVILATACVTALVVLSVITFINRNRDQVASNTQNSEQPADEEDTETDGTANKQGQQLENSRNGKSDGSHLGDSSDKKSNAENQEATELNGNSLEEARGNVNSATDPAANDKEQTKIKQLDSLPKTQGSGADAGTKKSDTVSQGKGDSSEKKDDSEEVVNLFKDKDYDKKKGEASPKKAGIPENVDVKKPEEKKVAPEKKMTDSKELMAKAVSLVNGPPVGVMKTALEPTFRKPNLPDAKWIILAQEQPFYVNDSIFSLPDCRSKIEILESVRFYLFGLCELEIKANSGKVLPLVCLQKGITTLENMKEPNNTIDVRAQGKNFQVTFVDKISKVTVVSHDNPPAKGVAPILQLVAEQGRAIIKFDSEVKSLEENQMIVFNGKSHEILPVKERPSELVKKLDTLTTSSKEIFFSLCLENPVFEVAVSKAISDSRPYLRKFVVEATLSQGRFEELIKFLNDPANKSFWREAVLDFRRHVLSDKTLFDQAKAFYTDFRSDDPANPKQGRQLFNILTVVSDQELISGQDAQLVGALESPSLFVRVGAIQSLFALTGKTKFFRPEDKKDKRSKWVKAWEKSLNQEEIRISTPFQHVQFK